MQRVIRPFVVTIAALSLAGTAIAAQTKTPSSAAKAAPATQQTSASTSKPAKTKSTSTSLVATGKIATFDPASQALTLTTSKGEQQFTVGPSARLQESSKTITVADLGKLTGHKATVHYNETSGTKNVESIHVSSSAAKTSTKS
jgi:hypothetical protein